MGVDLQTYRAKIGTYKFSNGRDVLTLTCVVNFSGGLQTIGSVMFIGMLLIMAGVETNPGPNEGIKNTGRERKIPPTTAQNKDTGVDCKTIGDSAFMNVLEMLKLTDKFPGIISLQDVVTVYLDDKEINENTPENAPITFLRKVMMLDCSARDTVLSDLSSDSECQDTDDEDDLDKLLSDDMGSTGGNAGLSPLDVFLATFQCCKPALKQLLFQKMFLCKMAVPFMYVDGGLTKPILVLWPLEPLSIFSSSLTSSEPKVLTMSTHVVTFARFGRPDISKSQILNNTISDNESNPHATFFHKDCEGGMKRRTMSEHFIEIFWISRSLKKQEKMKVDITSEDVRDTVPENKQTTTFLNMRGPITRFDSETIQLIGHLSDCIVITVDLSDLSNNYEQRVKLLKTFRFVVMVFLNPIDHATMPLLKRLKDDCKDFLKILITDANSSLRILTAKLIKEFEKGITTFPQPMAERLTSFQRITIITDEEDLPCQEGRTIAAKIFSTMEVDSTSDVYNRTTGDISYCKWKDATVPVSYNHSRKLGELTRRLAKATLTETCKLNDDIRELRLLQTKTITNTVKLFATQLTQIPQQSNVLHYMIGWLKIFIEINVRKQSSSLLKARWHAHAQLPLIPKEEQQRVEEMKGHIASLDDAIDNVMLGVEHLFREISHICDSVIALNGNTLSDSLSLDNLAGVFAELICEGDGFELVDGDNLYMTTHWTKQLLDAVCLKVGRKKVLSISVLGLQSSGKSTMLNTMFGLHFSVSSGRCTKGIHAQLVPVRHYQSSETPFQYIIIIDSEGLRAPEREDIIHTNTLDNELATFVTGLGDITLLNIMGENMADLRDVLQIVVHAIIRLKQANNTLKLHQTFMFLHHNVNDVSAGENMRDGFINMVCIMDEVTMSSAESEGINNVTRFNDVINFDINSNIFFTPNHWQGPIALQRVNTEYSEKINQIKSQILRPPTDMAFAQLSDFSVKVIDLWKGVLAENFVFSFRNSLEIKAYCQMERKMRHLVRELETYVYDELIKSLDTNFKNCSDKNQIKCMEETVVKTVLQQLKKKEKDTLKKIETLFQDHEYRDIILKWKCDQLHTVVTRASELKAIIKLDAKTFGKKQSLKIKANSEISGEDKLNLHIASQKLATQLRQQNYEHAELDTLFNKEVWEKYELKLFSKHYTLADINVKEIFQRQLSIHFDKHFPILKTELSKFAVKTHEFQLDGSFEMTGIGIDDISFSSERRVALNDLHELISNVFKDTEKNIREIQQNEEEIDEKRIANFLHSLGTSLDEMKTRAENVSFKPIFDVKLFVHVCIYTYPLFEKHNNQYHMSINDEVRRHANRLKENLKLEFQAELEGRKEEERAAQLFCQEIANIVIDTVRERLQFIVECALYRKLPVIKQDLIGDVCEDLVRNQRCMDFFVYIDQPDKYVKEWLNVRSETVLFKDGLYHELARNEIDAIFSEIECSVRALCTNNKEQTTRAWLSQVLLCLKGCCWERDHFDMFIQIKTIKDIQNFTDIILGCQHIPSLLEAKRKLVYKHFSDEENKIDILPCVEKIFTASWGCAESCPFCGEPCIKTAKHPRSNHICQEHRPECCRGYKNKKGEASLKVCNYLVSTTKGYPCALTHYKCNLEKKGSCVKRVHAFKDYRKLFPDWDIEPSVDMYAGSKFWMWFVAAYNKQLEEYYDMKIVSFPKEWTYVTDSSAISSLRI